jgi:hypothetical protein
VATIQATSEKMACGVGSGMWGLVGIGSLLVLIN